MTLLYMRNAIIELLLITVTSDDSIIVTTSSPPPRTWLDMVFTVYELAHRSVKPVRCNSSLSTATQIPQSRPICSRCCQCLSWRAIISFLPSFQQGIFLSRCIRVSDFSSESQHQDKQLLGRRGVHLGYSMGGS